MQCIFIPGFVIDEFLGYRNVTISFIWFVTFVIFAIYCSQMELMEKINFKTKKIIKLLSRVILNN